MSYQVIARKWRPQTFEEVTGQEHITRTLRNAVEHERLHHAYLFSGARGVGKTTTARLLAKAVNCHRSDRPTPTPCRATDPDACPSCREIAEGRSIDVLEIDAASNTGVDNVRDAIINTVGVRPARDRYKVFIIDEVHMLSAAAFNALLKTLEEPPPRVLFIMATTHPHKVPETILSRSQQFEFRTIAAPKIAERLRLIADAEGIEVSDDALREIARAGEGSMRDAQSAFDQVISFSGAAEETASSQPPTEMISGAGGARGRRAVGTPAIQVEDVETALGIAGSEMLARVMRAVAEQRPAEALAVVEDLAARGHDLRNFCRDLLAHVRDLLVFKVAGDSSAEAFAGRAEQQELASVAREFSESDLVRFFHSLTDTETRLRESAHPRYQLEIGLVKLVEMRRLAPLGEIIERLNALEESLRGGGRAPAGGARGQQTQPPPASSTGSAGAGPRRGSAVGGRRGSSVLAADSAESHEAQPPPVGFAANASDGAGAFDAQGRSDAQAHGDAQGRGDAVAQMRPGASNAARTPPPSTTPALKLVPPPSAFSGGAPSFAGDDASRADEAPFALGDAPSNTSRDQVGLPVALVTSHANANGTGAAVAPEATGARGITSEAAGARGAASEVTGARASIPEGARGVAHEGALGIKTASASAETGDADAGDLAGRIKRGLEERGKPLLAVAFEGARRVRIEGDEVRVEFAPEAKHLHDPLKKPESQRLLREVCCEVLGCSVGVAVLLRGPGELGDEPRTPEDAARREQRLLREQVEGHPDVQRMLKTFRGSEIVDVRRTDDAPPQ
jgi:DNA polymerase III subunit gamma/tau